jgi:hypothetical protein
MHEGVKLATKQRHCRFWVSGVSDSKGPGYNSIGERHIVEAPSQAHSIAQIVRNKDKVAI